MEPKETFRGDEWVFGLDYGDGFMDVYLSPNSLNCKPYICTAFWISIIPQ